MRPTVALLVIVILSLAFDSLGAGLRDNPIVGDSLVYLDGKWDLKSDNNIQIVGTVPGDLITDLQTSGKIGDPIYDTTWLQSSSLWNNHEWTYSKTFSYQKVQGSGEVLLVFDGVKMGARVYLNDVLLDTVFDQFLRYQYPVNKHLASNGQNTLKVTFPAGNAIYTEGRFMACSGGWDWAPYSNTNDGHGAFTFSKGIWKSVYLTTVSKLAITHVVPLTTYRGDYPTSLLNDDNHAGFNVSVAIHLWSPAGAQGSFSIITDWGVTMGGNVIAPAGESVMIRSMEASKVKLWWPAGLGAQNLYSFDLNVYSGDAKLSTSRTLGFRTFALVTADDSEPSKIKDEDGSGSLTMRFKVNGANMWSRGGNMIPMEEFEGRANEAAFVQLLQSAVDAKFNTLRIWGGGIFQYDIFYDTADKLGLLMYHDMMYAQQSHSPNASSTTQKLELQHNVRRLSSHPSIVLWDACNECGGQGVYADFVATVVAKEDPSRPIWPSCPAAGWASGVDRLWGLPNGKRLVPRPPSSIFETHGPYQHGNGWPAVNDQDGKMHLFPPNLPPNLKSPSPLGPEKNGVYASEFGCITWSSFESLSVTVDSKDWSLHSPPMYQRNYPCDNVIQVYWGTKPYSVGQEALRQQLYTCLLGSMLELKEDIETRRSGNEWGTVVWQLNEIWPTGGWGTVEYGTPVNGQILGGRWKPIMYALAASLFTNVTATCGTSAQCYVKNDGVVPFTGNVEVTLVHFQTALKTTLSNAPVSLSAGAGVIQWFCAKGSSSPCQSWDQIFQANNCDGGKSCILTVQVKDNVGHLLSDNVVALQTPGNMNLLTTTVRYEITDESNGATIILRTNNVAPYVILTTQASGRFDRNVLLLVPNSPVTIRFTATPGSYWDLKLFTSSLRVEHVKQYQ